VEGQSFQGVRPARVLYRGFFSLGGQVQGAALACPPRTDKSNPSVTTRHKFLANSSAHTRLSRLGTYTMTGSPLAGRLRDCGLVTSKPRHAGTLPAASRTFVTRTAGTRSSTALARIQRAARAARTHAGAARSRVRPQHAAAPSLAAPVVSGMTGAAWSTEDAPRAVVG
jgi:hypothetical protein